MLDVKLKGITPDNTVFVLLSFEGPDPYSLAGGLGVRINHLSRTMADIGFTTHLFFIGDPNLPGEEVSRGGKLFLHRWCQWLSRYYPKGVYDGEEAKLQDFTGSIPSFIKEQVVKPAVAEGKVVAVLAEEWQTVDALCQLSDLLYKDGIREKAIMFWNANNTYSFERVNWARLNFAARLTTVSRYMKHIMGRMGLDTLVIPNGIPRCLLSGVDDSLSRRLRQSFDADMLLSKVARWHPDKRWKEAMEVVARLKSNGVKTTLVAVSGIEGYGDEVVAYARTLGLTVKDASKRADTFDGYLSSMKAMLPADVIIIKYHMPLDFLSIMYRASDAVLANSLHEPFGIVGLETMAAGGVAFVGATGEDYAISFVNSLMIETDDPSEIIGYILYLREHPEESERLRNIGRITARYFTWEAALQILINRLETQAASQGIIDMFVPSRTACLHPAFGTFKNLSDKPEVKELLSSRFNR